jgi:Ca2+/Na+ antiporter
MDGWQRKGELCLEKQEVQGKENVDVLLAQWQTCVDMANAVSERRDNMNNLFVTVNLALVAAVSFLWDVKTIALLLAGITVCVVWVIFINNFKHLNTAKFAVINEIEKKLPVAAFQQEWNILREEKKYKDGTWLEKVLPFAFGLLYVAMLVILIFSNIGGAST